MTDTPKDKRAAALEKIKALSNRRSSTSAGPGGAKNAPGGGLRKGAKGGGGARHRPQGG